MFILKYETITYSAYWNAVKVWDTIHDHDDPGKRFMEFLGVHHVDAVPGGFQMPERAVQKLRMLLGPNAKIMVRAWYAKYDGS